MPRRRRRQVELERGLGTPALFATAYGGMVTNGYSAVGGGVVADISFDPSATSPNPNRPKNVVAGYWTDSDSSARCNDPHRHATDRVSSWLVRDGTSAKTLAGDPATARSTRCSPLRRRPAARRRSPYKATSSSTGRVPSLASLTSSLTPGTTQVPVKLTVTR